MKHYDQYYESEIDENNEQIEMNLDSVSDTNEDENLDVTEDVDVTEDEIEYEPELETVSEVKKGVVNCGQLNVRAETSKDSEILGVIKQGVEVIIEDASDDFYKVCTEAGLDGYCMKQFIDSI